jgi:cytochrome bd-type quinol oxidase subunit 2
MSVRYRSVLVRRRGLLRAGLGVLAVGDALVGGWALAMPGSFYRGFPGLGMHWVSAAPPYNEHLLVDFGAALLGIAVALALAAVAGERRVARVALIAALVQAVPHLLFHLSHQDALRGDELAVSRLALVVPVMLALALLWLSRGADDVPLADGSVGQTSAVGSAR